MNPLFFVTFLVLGTTAHPYNPTSTPVRISYGTNSPSSLSSTSFSSQPSSYRQQQHTTTTSSAPSSYSAPIVSPSSYSSPVAQTYYSSPQATPSYYLSSSPSYAQPSSGDRNAAITSFTRNIQPSNSDTTSFTTSNGISSSHNVHVIRGRPSSYQDENGQMVQTDTTIAMSGHSYHQSPEGMHISLNWSADENSGFVAEGDHLPKSVQMPTDQAEAHRQAYLVASQGYGSTNSGGNGGGNSSPTSGYGGSSSSPSNGGGYGSAISSSSSSGGYNGGTSSGYKGPSSSPSNGGGYGSAISSSSSSGGYNGGASSYPKNGYNGGSSSSPNYGSSLSPIILNYEIYSAAPQQSAYRPPNHRGYY